MFHHFANVMISPIALIVSLILLYNEIGYAGFVAIVVIVLVALLQISISRLFSKLRLVFLSFWYIYLTYFSTRLKVSDKTDKRVKVMNEVISGIRVIKMYGWEYAFHRLVSRLRRYVYI